MNLVTDNIPAIMLGFNPSSPDIMSEGPRKSTHILNISLIKLLMGSGLIMGILTLVSFYISFNMMKSSMDIARTTALCTLILLEIFNAFNFRSFRKNTLNRSPLTNKYLVYASFISVLATLVIVYTGVNTIFSTAPLGITDLINCIGIALFGVLVFDLVKFINNKNKAFIVDTR
jgi:P-type Ca2+ transporter type 2C